MPGPRPSGGITPPPTPLHDANQAVALLATMHKWSCTMTQDGDHVRYVIDVRQAGRRVRGSGRTFVGAVMTALGKFRGIEPSSPPQQHQLKLTR
jgi:hypothetical protein